MGQSQCKTGFYLIVIAATMMTVFTDAQGTSRKGSICIDQKTCGACIAAGPECGWCTQKGYDEVNKARCDLYKNLLSKNCDKTFIIMPDHDSENITNFPPRNSGPTTEAIQLSPQKIRVKIRPNKPFEFNMIFRQAENYPVDLYYVMDLSYSMGDDKAKLAELGGLLAQSMVEITENFKLGFGSFIDKKTMPYVSTVPSSLIKPCTGCVAPYGFKNQLKLTENTDLFKTRVLAADISGNLDAPEGGFDAIMQAIACKGEIGWRKQSRKMLLFSTDAGFHFAGDGKLGGIVKPNDGSCHLDDRGFYSESLNQDYPSISQISNKIQEEKVNVIFAVTRNQLEVYKKLSRFIQGSVVGVLANDSSNVVNLVSENYAKISSVVDMRMEGGSGMHVKFMTKCDENSEYKEGALCENVTIGQTIQYKVSLEVRECPEKMEDLTKTVSISPIGLADKLTIELEMMCECDCEKPEFEVQNSSQCNGKGTFECGACTCNEGFYGKNCECDGTTVSNKDYEAACKMTNNSKVCEGHGECVCGECDCFPVSPGNTEQLYSGAFCECNDYSCDYSFSMICGGEERGKCTCGECVCEPGYIGEACECATSQETCKSADGKICNGKGRCECGKCICDPKENHRGPTCEDCPTCPGKCEANKACVQCRAFKTGELTPEECADKCDHVTLVDQVEENEEWRLCRARDEEDGCYFYFIYQYNGNQVEAQRTKECPKPVNILAIVLGVIAAIVLIGLLLLLLWKVIVTLYDRREYAKFEKEVEKARWDMAENPIFKPATSTYTNPMR